MLRHTPNPAGGHAVVACESHSSYVNVCGATTRVDAPGCTRSQLHHKAIDGRANPRNYGVLSPFAHRVTNCYHIDWTSAVALSPRFRPSFLCCPCTCPYSHGESHQQLADYHPMPYTYGIFTCAITATPGLSFLTVAFCSHQGAGMTTLVRLTYCSCQDPVTTDRCLIATSSVTPGLWPLSNCFRRFYCSHAHTNAPRLDSHDDLITTRSHAVSACTACTARPVHTARIAHHARTLAFTFLHAPHVPQNRSLYALCAPHVHRACVHVFHFTSFRRN